MISAGRTNRIRSRFRRVFGYIRMAGTLFLVGACPLTAIAPATAAVAVPTSSGNDKPVTTSPLASPVDIVIAVDESGSIKPTVMTLERTAARLIALGEFAPTSRIGVLGFGGPDGDYNAQTNPQPPVDPVCPMTKVDSPASRQALGDCIGKLQIRTYKQGNQTDFIDAISDGVSELTGTGNTRRPLLLFLLTDGKLDMVGSPAFPEMTARRSMPRRISTC